MHNIAGVRATSYHQDVRSLRGELTVQRVFPRAWHLLHDDGRVLTVTTAPYNGPLAILLARPALDDLHIRPGMHASLHANLLLVGSVAIPLDQATPWSPRPPADAPPLSLPTLHRDLRTLNMARTSIPAPDVARTSSAGRTESGDPLRSAMGEKRFPVGLPLPYQGGPAGTVSRPHHPRSPATSSPSNTISHLELSEPSMPRARRDRVADETAALMGALLHRDETHLRHHISSLIGLGPGLTPAGDDILTGLLAGLHVLKHRAPAPHHCTSTLAILTDIVERRAPNRTTALSQTLLFYAARGIAVEPLLDVLWTLGSGSPIRSLTPTNVGGLDALLAIGHSSGSDMLTGALLAAQTLLGWADPAQSPGRDRPVVVAPVATATGTHGHPPTYKEHNP